MNTLHQYSYYWHSMIRVHSLIHLFLFRFTADLVNGFHILFLGARKTDVILIIDTTQHFFCRVKCQREIKLFIRKFVNAFNVDRSNTRFALLAYAKYVDTLITLNEYNDETDLLSLLDDLTSKTFNVKETALALYEARRLFREESTDDRKKIVVIFTNGFSRGRLVILPEASVGGVILKKLYFNSTSFQSSYPLFVPRHWPPNFGSDSNFEVVGCYSKLYSFAQSSLSINTMHGVFPWGDLWIHWIIISLFKFHSSIIRLNNIIAKVVCVIHKIIKMKLIKHIILDKILFWFHILKLQSCFCKYHTYSNSLNLI